MLNMEFEIIIMIKFIKILLYKANKSIKNKIFLFLR